MTRLLVTTSSSSSSSSAAARHLLSFAGGVLVALVAHSLASSLGASPPSKERRRRGQKRSKIAVGTTNRCKLKAVRDTIDEYDQFGACAEICACKIASGVSEQPIGIETTVSQGSPDKNWPARQVQCLRYITLYV